MIYFDKLGKNGGFGNQLFQYAVSYEYSKKFQTDICILPHKSYYHKSKNMMSHFIIDYMNLPIKILNNISPKNTFYESERLYNKSIETIKDETNLFGYFQSEKYFSNTKSEIISLYNNHCFKSQVSSYFNSKGLIPSEITGIQVRRNDYLKISKRIGCPQLVQPLEYFNSAIEKCKSTQYLVVCDDKMWCKDVFGGRPNFTIVETDNDIIDFYILSGCRNQIISNSSFGWWAAYLNTFNDKIVICPKNWWPTSSGNISISDLIPKNNNWNVI